jgi:hypothetical protein
MLARRTPTQIRRAPHRGNTQVYARWSATHTSVPHHNHALLQDLRKESRSFRQSGVLAIGLGALTTAVSESSWILGSALILVGGGMAGQYLAIMSEIRKLERELANAP